MKTRRDMVPYYWESPAGAGMFMESDDESALKRKPENTVLLYKESDNSDGLPFVVVYEYRGEKKRSDGVF